SLAMQPRPHRERVVVLAQAIAMLLEAEDDPRQRAERRRRAAGGAMRVAEAGRLLRPAALLAVEAVGRRLAVLAPAAHLGFVEVALAPLAPVDGERAHPQRAVLPEDRERILDDAGVQRLAQRMREVLG